MDTSIYPEPVRHRVLWKGEVRDFSVYEVALIGRLAQQRAVPSEGGPVAAQLVRRLTEDGIHPAALLDAIRREGIEVPQIEVMDDAELMQSVRAQNIVEAILTQHLDRWIDMDQAPEGRDDA